VLAVSVPLLGAVKRNHTLRPRLPLPHPGAGSVESVVAAVVVTMVLYDVVVMAVALLHVSFVPAAVGTSVRVGVGGAV